MDVDAYLFRFHTVVIKCDQKSITWKQLPCIYSPLSIWHFSWVCNTLRHVYMRSHTIISFLSIAQQTFQKQLVLGAKNISKGVVMQ